MLTSSLTSADMSDASAGDARVTIVGHSEPAHATGPDMTIAVDQLLSQLSQLSLWVSSTLLSVRKCVFCSS